MKASAVNVVVAAMMMMMMMLVLVMSSAVQAAAVGERSSRHKRSTNGGLWSRWFNTDSPRDGDGDFETSDSIKKTYKICRYGEQVAAAQCRVAGTNDSFDSTTTAFVNDHLLQACSKHGLICLNAQQASGLCEDYEVRFLCRDPESDSSGGSIFPNFDFKIYIILALVPLLIVSLRILWSCCCKGRFKRGRQLQGRLRSQRGSFASGTLSTSSSQASFDSALANPLPSYSDLFGEVQNGGVFAISNGGCAACGKCVHHASVGPFRSFSGPSESYGFPQGRLNSLAGPSESRAVGEGERRATASGEAGAADNADEVFANSEGNVPATTSESAPVTSQQPRGTIFSHRLSITSVTSVLGAVGLPVSSIPAHAPPSTPCACACHQGHMNLAFHWESADHVNSPAPVVYPGMHKPVFSFSRIGSVSSFTSFTEPPDYEEALEILKKSAPADFEDEALKVTV